MHIDYSRLPEHMQDAARKYIEHGIEPGSFLTAVICNDLAGAVGRADYINRERLIDWVRFFYNDAPAGCWGTPEFFVNWMKQGGMQAYRQGEAS